MAKLPRLLTAMVTPFDDEGRVDYEQAKRLARALLASGSEGLVLAGSTGEAPTLSLEEKLRLFREVKAAVTQGATVVAGTGTYNTAESVELTREAEAAGVDGVLAVVPYYNKPPQEGMVRHFEAIAAATRLPVILYNIPGRSGVNMTAETTLRLAEVPNIVGIKEASGDLRQVARIIAEAPEGFHVWSGNDEETLPILALGGYGVICVVSHLAGRQMHQLVEHAVAGRTAEAAAIHRRLLPLMTTLMTAAANPIPVKHALNHIGVRVGAPRLPLVAPDPETARKIEAAVAAQQVDLTVAA